MPEYPNKNIHFFRSSREPDPGVSEGICCIIYAAPHTELKGAFHLYIVYSPDNFSYPYEKSSIFFGIC